MQKPRRKQRLKIAALLPFLLCSIPLSAQQPTPAEAPQNPEQKPARPKVRENYSAKKRFDHLQPRDLRGYWEKRRDQEFRKHIRRIAILDVAEADAIKDANKHRLGYIAEIRRLELARHRDRLKAMWQWLERGTDTVDAKNVESVAALRNTHEDTTQRWAGHENEPGSLQKKLMQLRSRVYKEWKQRHQFEP